MPQRATDESGGKLHRLLRSRLTLPGALVGVIGVVSGLALLSSGAASGQTGSTSTSSTSPAQPRAATSPGDITNQNTTPASKGAGQPVGARSGRVYIIRNGRILAYGNRHTIVYTAPPRAFVPAGQALFEQDCSSCHGPQAQGTAYGPNLVGLGPATIDFWITTGRMPAKNPRAVQAPVKPPQLTNRQALEVAAYVDSLAPSLPYIPHVNLNSANLAEGADLFSINCAACHTILGAGDALAKNTFAPSLHLNGQPNARQVAEAIRTGPTNMPRFNGGNLTDAQVADITKYVVEKIQHPSNIGGFPLGGIGPVTEGFIGLLFGVGGMMLICYWTGDRTEKESEEGESGESGESGGSASPGNGHGDQPAPQPVGGGHA